MALPKSYLTSTKRLPDILEAIQTAQAPKTFSTRFLIALGFKSKGDRLIIGVFKDLGMVDDKGAPINRYYKFLDQTHSGSVLAEGIKEAWADLFAININAHQMEKTEFIGKLRTLSQGSLSDIVMKNHYVTFSALVKNADFTRHQKKPPKVVIPKKDKSRVESTTEIESKIDIPAKAGSKIGGLIYNIQIVLPESRDPVVYDALFRSLKEHLL